MFCGVVMSVKTAAPAASSVRQKRARLVPASDVLPSPTYIRVLPPGSLLRANSARSALFAGFRAGLICVHVAPLFSERQMPSGKDDWWGSFEFLGSTATSFVPRMFVARSSVHVEPLCRYTPRTAHPCGVGQPIAPPRPG